MYLKRLDLLGFKSFANKTAVHFSSGITAIVGPNGCGKTNILDALRWVLGEQKVTLLRGSKMEEVIFNGTRETKPLGMSEVTLTLVNNRGVLPTEYTEVQVTRRLFRSGESEYLLNKVPCRLKDIHELFFDTGIGAHSYSVIQQEMIEAVISDKAEERRFLFEEAAGITKYKQRKKAALRKLQATDADLLRLRDIYAEVQTQVRSLNRQQKKAQRYKNITEDIRDWELYLGKLRLTEADQRKRELQAEMDSLIAKKTGQETNLTKVSSLLEVDRKEQIDLEHELTEIGNEVYEISEKAHTLEREVSILVEKKSNARQLIERNQQEIHGLHTREQILAEQVREAELELDDQKANLDSLQWQLTEAEKEQAEADKKLLAARSSKDAENQTLLELEGKLSSGKTEEDGLRQQGSELSQTLADYDQQLESSRKTQPELTTDYANIQASCDELAASRTQAERDRTAIGIRMEEAADKSEALALEISNLAASIEACQARRSMLEDMIVHFEGYSAGVVSVMEMSERWPAIAGTVADRFTPAEGYAVAAEAALSELAGYLICRDRNTAEEIVNYLKTENKGRIGILVPDSGTINPVVKRPELPVDGFVGWMDEYVSADDDLKPLMQAILARVAVFKADCQPDEILSRLPYGFSAVSTDGMVYRQNIIAGGGEDQLPLFRRREKLKEQEKQIEDLSNRLEQSKRDKDQLAASQAADRAESTRLTDLMDSLSESISQANQKRSEIQFRLEALAEELNRLQRERQTTNARLEQIRDRQYSLGLDFNKLTSKKESLVDSMNQAHTDLQQLENAASAAIDNFSRVQVLGVESRSQTEQTESRISHLGELRHEILSTADAKKQEIGQAELDIRTSEQRVNDLETELKTVFGSRTTATERQMTLRTSMGDIQTRVDERENQVKTIRSERDTLSEQAHQTDIQLNTHSSEISSLCERIREEYDLDIRSHESKRPDEKLTNPEAKDLLIQLKEKLKNFGAVNLLALEEYQTAFERETFLKDQLEDLTTAKDDLQSTITKINRTARQLFQETFDKVKVNFQSLFVDLFTGGEADILLEDPSDPLESDIHIIARPRGKKLLSITMMSGGERALTAIALLFSLYLVKPSPFCILDEIDAPLDDANCRRFLNIINTFSNQTQFIVITHNKITMERAQNLYGITMEKAGISKLVAVKFTDIAESDTPGDLISEPTPEELAASLDQPAIEIEIEQPSEIASDQELPEPVVERMQSNVSASEDTNTDLQD